jgi:multidrug efflux system membrane fusion protein
VIDKPAFIGLGMTATLAFERPDAQPVAEVPLAAIFQHGTRPAVWVVDKSTGVVELRPVEIARWRSDSAAIRSGVKDGELIATAGVHKLEPGQKVKPQQQQAAAR